MFNDGLRKVLMTDMPSLSVPARAARVLRALGARKKCPPHSRKTGEAGNVPISVLRAADSAEGATKTILPAGSLISAASIGCKP